MKILTMFFANYGSFFGEHSFSFSDRGIALILGRNLDEPRMRSNGAGKSTIGDALEWCLFGEVPRDDVADSIVNAESGKGTSVTVQVLDDDGAVVQVQRTRKMKDVANGPRVWRNGAELTALDADVTQRKIEELLGLDRQVFRSAVMFAQGESFTFADATDAERKEILTKVLQLEEIDDWAATLDEKRDAVGAQRADLSGKLIATTTELASLEARAPRAAVQVWEDDRAAALATLASQAQQKEHALAAVTAAQQRLVQPPQPPQPPAPDFRQVDGDLAKFAALIAAANIELGQERARYRDVQERLRAVNERGSATCRECGQVITAEHVANEAAALQQILATLVLSGKAAAARLAELEQQRAAASSHRASLEAERHALTQQYAAVNAAAQQARWEAQQLATAAGVATREVAHLRAAYDARAAQTNPFLAEAVRIEGRVTFLRAQFGELEAARVRLEEEDAYLTFWKTGLGSRGLKSYVLDARLDEMSTEANRWVQLLTGGTIWVRFETQRAVGKGSKQKLADNFNVRVFRHNPDGTITERNYRSWSGGEKHRVALGIDFGLARLIASRSRRAYDLLILDEIFQKSLDGAGKEAVAEMLRHLAAEKSSILVVDHDVIFQGLFEDTIVVEKKNGRSKIIEGAAS